MEKEKDFNQEEEQQKNIICAEDAGPVVSVVSEEEQEGSGRYSFLKKGDVYQFAVVEEVGWMNESGAFSDVENCIPTIIIGEVDSVNNKMVKLASWAYKSEPTIIRSESEIIVIECEDVMLDDWYKFMDARMKSLEVKEKENFSEEYTEEYRLIEHNFAKHIVEDITRGRVSLVHKVASKMAADDKEHYFIYPKPSKIFMYKEEPFCEVTEQIMKIVKNPENFPVLFGNDVVEFIDYFAEVEKVKTNANKHIEKQFEEKNADELKSMKEALDAFAKDKTTETSSLAKEILKTTVYDNAKEASESIDEDSEEAFIVINKKDDDTAYMVITDDIHSILHSRKIAKKNKTIIIGPLEDSVNGTVFELPLSL